MQKKQNVIAGISKKLKNKKWKCMVDNCDEIAINSHLIQQNGLLSNISSNGHLIELRMIDAYKWVNNKLPFEFCRVGIKHALTHKIFCSKHDSGIFKPIETDCTNFESLEAFLLLSYRSVCAEIRKKEINIDQFTEMLKSKVLLGKIEYDFYNSNIEGNKLGIQDLMILKKDFEAEIESKRGKYRFFVHKYPKFEIYASAIFSANDIDYFQHFLEPDLDNVYIHFLPLVDNFLILVGYDCDHVSDKIITFCDSWLNLSMENLQKKVTTLFTYNVENWGLSIDLYNKISAKTKAKFIKKLVLNENLLGISDDTYFNLFEN